MSLTHSAYRALLGVGLALAVATPASAGKLFSSTVTVDTVVGRLGTNSLLDVPDFYDTSTLTEINPGFDSSSEGFVGALNLRGVGSFVSFEASTQSLALSIPGVLEIGFDEGSLDANMDALEDWLQGDWNTAEAPQDAVESLLKAWAKNSPVEPVAGNPNSLMTRMTNADFVLGSEGPFFHSDTPLASAPGQTGVRFDYSYAKAGDWNMNAYELSIDHRFNFKSLPNLSAIVSFPVAGTETEGQWTGMGSLGVGVQYRPTERWSITPMVRTGVVGSLDVGAAAVLFSATLNSHAGFSLQKLYAPLPDIQIGITNQLGYARSIQDIKIGDFRLDYGLENGILRNGGYFAGRLGDSSLGWKLFGTASCWFGDDLYLESYANLGGEVHVLGEIDGTPFERLTFALAYTGNFGDWDSLSVGLRGRF